MIRFFEVVVEIARDPVYRGLIVSVAVILLFGTVFYSLVEEWSALDSLYFSVVTLATVGYGDYTPDTALGKFVTIFFIFAGIGIFATFIGTVADRMSREGTMFQRRRARRREQAEREHESETPRFNRFGARPDPQHESSAESEEAEA